MRNYLLCYDIRHPKRLRRVAKIGYGYALGGQKSVLEMPLERMEAELLAQRLRETICEKEDSIVIVPFVGEPILLGRADFLTFDDGVVVI